MVAAPQLVLELVLRDGTPVVVRPIVPEDKEELRAGVRALSEGSRYRRFTGAVRDLSDAQLRFLTEIDYRNHMAWVALDARGSDQTGLGVARYVRLRDQPHVAEAAVTVVDEYHGRGLGTALLGILAMSALANGIRTFRAYVLAENRPMLDILHQLGARAESEGGGLLRIDVPIPEDASALPDTPAGRVLKAVATQLLPPPVARRAWASLADAPD